MRRKLWRRGLRLDKQDKNLFLSFPGWRWGNAGIQSIDISADGRYVAFSAWSSNLVNNDTNGEMDVFVRDRTAGTTTRVSVDENGDQIDVEATNPKISNDGRFVVFLTAAALVSEDTNNTDDVYLYDLVNEEPLWFQKSMMDPESRTHYPAMPWISPETAVISLMAVRPLTSYME